ncbi:MAG: PD-(D/E)XK nuclease family protein [Lachnospiraceae bacterium]|nr:PD-(D/E)XK nuclease family protein [Lachnospiraceae bacterium]
MEIQISVRGMVEFLFRNGDIDNTAATAPADAMLEGGRIHRMIQKRAGAEYEAEVPLSYTVDFGEYSLKIDGRADGIMTNDTDVIIDEIKGTYRDLKNINDPKPEHLAQAKCYAYIYLTKEGLDEIKVRMTYCNIDTEEIRYFYEAYSKEEITLWFESVISEYKRWTDYSVEWQKKRVSSVEGLKFPYEYREGQKELMENVYKTIYHKKKLFIQAPTGVGKTLATLYPAILSGNKAMCDKLFYLTAKTVTGSVAVNAFDILRNNGLTFKSIQITAKEKVCANETCDCNPVACPYAKGHFDRVNEALYDLLTHEEDLRRETIAEYAEKHMVCPFELSLDASLFADGIICDYNYLFDPHVYLKRFFADGNTQNNYVFLIDEAHNLLERGRDMYSATLVKENFLLVKRILKSGPLPLENRFIKRINKWIDKCNSELLKLKKLMDERSIGVEINAFVSALQNLYLAYNAYLDERLQTPDDEAFLQLYFDISHFLGIYEEIDDNYVIYTDMPSSGDFLLKLYCVDPSNLLRRCMNRGRSSILFSATFLPIQYYKKLLGGEAEDYEVYAHSIFDPLKRGVFIGEGVSTLYTDRNENEYAKVASYIRRVVSAKPGNYMVFFPSHAFLNSVYSIFEDRELPFMDNTECVIQENVMKEEDRENFLSMFSEDNISSGSDKTLIGFCVLGGIFSEGIDLKGDSLIGSIIVGPGIPQICKERGILKDFFSAHGENGFDYAYRYPGMNKVLQAAGRVIRTAEDIGIVVLLDNRFKNYDYVKLFPREWENVKTMNLDISDEVISDFWKTHFAR